MFPAIVAATTGVTVGTITSYMYAYLIQGMYKLGVWFGISPDVQLWIQTAAVCIVAITLAAYLTAYSRVKNSRVYQGWYTF